MVNNDFLEIVKGIENQCIAPNFSYNFSCPYRYENANNTIVQHEVIDAICKE